MNCRLWHDQLDILGKCVNQRPPAQRPPDFDETGKEDVCFDAAGTTREIRFFHSASLANNANQAHGCTSGAGTYLLVSSEVLAQLSPRVVTVHAHHQHRYGRELQRSFGSCAIRILRATRSVGSSPHFSSTCLSMQLPSTLCLQVPEICHNTRMRAAFIGCRSSCGA